MEFKKERRIVELLVLVVILVWFYHEQSWQSGVAALSALIFLSFDFLFDRKKIDNINVASEQQFKADREFYLRLINTLPHDTKMEDWLKNKPMGQRGLSFDYFDKVFNFAETYGRETEFFHDPILNALLNDLISQINVFRMNTAQYMSPSSLKENRFEVKRHYDFKAFDHKLDVRENEQMQELDNNATEVYNSFVNLYVGCKKKFMI